MAKVRFTHAAKADILEIGEFTVERSGPGQGDRYLSALEACCVRLAGNPGMSRDCAHIDRGLRRFEHAKHVVFYRISRDGIDVLRILHYGMLAERYFPESQDEASE